MDLSPLVAPRAVAGADVRYTRGAAWAAVAVVSLPDLLLETSLVVRGQPGFSYHPGLFCFREGPLVAEALDTLYQRPDCLLVDGHGLMHPRGFGLACYVGVLFDLPCVGVAKSPCRGLEWSPPGAIRGSWTPVQWKGRWVGATLRTRTGVRPVWVSPGHRCDLESAIRIVLSVSRTRIPEPLRRAHAAAGAMARLGAGA